ncbi:MAG: hypothetical protein ACI8UO_006095 [Verrucomicrobiales bacterium]|jgi:hypothetical protein
MNIKSSLILLAASLLFFGVARANDTYNLRVTIHEYYGEVGHDSSGGHLYGAKVHHGHHYYYVYLHQPLPELRDHIHDKGRVQVASRSDRWLRLSIHNDSAQIHSVKVIRRN